MQLIMAFHIIMQDRTPYPILVDMILPIVLTLLYQTTPLSDMGYLEYLSIFAQHIVLLRPYALIPICNDPEIGTTQ